MGVISRLELSTILFKDLPSWTVEETMICKTFVFTTFSDAIKFVNAVAAKAEAASHHPDIDIRFNNVHICLVTHVLGGVTRKDVELALHIEALTR